MTKIDEDKCKSILSDPLLLLFLLLMMMMTMMKHLLPDWSVLLEEDRASKTKSVSAS